MITLKDIKNARPQIMDTGVKMTPVFSSEKLSNMVGNQLFFKGEHVQKIGAFKIRGAALKVEHEVKNGATHVVAASSGNHGQAVAYHAARLGVAATITAPENAVPCKREAIESYGGTVEFCGTTSETRIKRAKELAEEPGAVFIPPYDDPLIMAGQGTVGLEIIEQVQDIDVVYVPIGGGGLLSGTATAIKEMNPRVKVVGVEPREANDTYLSWKKGERVEIERTNTVADGLRASIPGELTFPVIQKYVDDIVLVSEKEIEEAFVLVLTRMKQLIEPSSAAAVAASLKHEGRNERIVTVLSGGNVDPAIISKLLTS